METRREDRRDQAFGPRWIRGARGALAATVLAAGLLATGCDDAGQSQSISGAKAIIASVPKDAEGKTAEQRNIEGRLELEKPGAVKHLYVISPNSGDVILYSTVKGKVTSAGKKLMPSDAYKGDESWTGVFDLGDGWKTSSRPNEDGTFGQAGTAAHMYVYWFDVRNNYHQHYLTGGQIVHISDVPMAFPKIILNLEASAEGAE